MEMHGDGIHEPETMERMETTEERLWPRRRRNVVVFQGRDGS
jgi:hypothetical protein